MAILGACSESATTTPTPVDAAGEVSADAADAAPALIFPLDFQASYTEVRNCRPTSEHGLGMLISVVASPDAAKAYTAGTYPFAEGTILVKTIFEDIDGTCSEVSTYSAMRKGAKGSSPTTGDWEWQETDASGTILTNRPAGNCFSCHSECASRDFACTDP